MDARTPERAWKWCGGCVELLPLIYFTPLARRLAYIRCLKCCQRQTHLFRHGYFVSALRTRRHILQLSKAGVGHRTLAELSEVDDRTISKIKKGNQRRISREHERAVLAVRAGGVCDRAYIPAAETHQRLAELDALGFTRTELARRLGHTGRRPHLNFGGTRTKLTALKALAIEKLYNQLARETCGKIGATQNDSQRHFD